MLTRWYTVLERRATARVIITLLVIFVAIAALVLPRAEARIKAASGGVGPIDLLTSYTPEQALEMVDAYGPDGRSFYAMIELTADVIYPLVYGFFFSLLLMALYRRYAAERPWLQALTLLPLAIMLIDFMENIAIVTLLLTHPARLTAVALLAGIFSMLKWMLFGVTLLLVLIGIVVWLVDRLRRGNS